MAKFVGSYDFEIRPGWAAFTVWQGPRVYTAIVVVDRDKHLTRKEMRDKDFEKLCYKAMAVITKYSRDPVLVISDGRPLSFKVRTEDEEIKEFAQNFLREHPEIILAGRFGPELKVEATKYLIERKN